MVSRLDGGYQAAPIPKFNSAPQSLAAQGTVGMGGAPTGRIAAASAPTPLQSVPTPAQQVLGGGGGGGGGAAAAGPAAAATNIAARPSLSDYITSNFLYNQQQGANQDNLNNYDQQSLKGAQDVGADQVFRGANLQQQLGDAGNSNANDLAAHGLLRSGINFQNQDKIDANGVNQQAGIDNLLTQFNSGRQSGRLNQQQANSQALNGIMNQLTTQFNAQNGATIV